MCINLHPALHIYIPQSCPSVARILESPFISVPIAEVSFKASKTYPTLTPVFYIAENLMKVLKNPKNRYV